MKKSIRPFENIFTIISLMFFSQGFFPFFLGGYSTELEGDLDSVLLRVVFLLIYSIAAILLIFRWQRTLIFLRTNLWLIFLISLAIISISWSSIPDVAYKRVISLVGTTIFGLYLGSSYSFKQQLKIYAFLFGFSILFIYLFAIAIPEYGIMNTDFISGAWRGIYPHKNGLGESMFVSFITFYFLSFSTNKYRKAYLFFCILSIISIYFGDSATSLVSVIFVLTIAQGLRKISLKSKKDIFLILILIIIAITFQFLLIQNFEKFLDINNKDITLSGRTPLWEDLWQFIQLKPWLGYGYGSFFSALHRETLTLWNIHQWIPVHSHNGYVQTCINLGFLGLMILIIGYSFCLFNSLVKYLVFQKTVYLWIFLFLLYTIFLNLTEVSFMTSNSIVWVVSVASIYSMNNST